MNFFKKIWNRIKRVFKKRPPTTEKVISEVKALLTQHIDKEEIYLQIKESDNAEQKAELIEQIAQHETAKSILEFTENETIISEQKKGRKKFYELHELRNELLVLVNKKATLEFAESQIKSASYPDTSAIDKRTNDLFSLLNKNKIDEKIELSDFSVFVFDKDFKELEKLLTEKSTLKRHGIREAEKQRQQVIYENKINKELNRLDTLINQSDFNEANQLIKTLRVSIKPNYKKGVTRLSKAVEKLKERELQIFKKQQEELLRKQAEEVERIRIANEKIEEERRIAREQEEALRKQEEEKRTEKLRKLNELLEFKFNWRDFEKVLQQNNILGFYHFTDRVNLKSIKENGGLYSWFYCDMNNIVIPKPGGSMGSRQNDTTNGKKDFVRIAFNKEHPMLFIAEKDGRISNAIWLNIDLKVAYFKNTEFSDKNAAAFSSYKPKIGNEVNYLENVRFDILKKAERVKHYNLSDDEKPYNQAEVLVKTWIPIEYITNINNFA
jgi:hypothetical protein